MREKETSRLRRKGRKELKVGCPGRVSIHAISGLLQQTPDTIQDKERGRKKDKEGEQREKKVVQTVRQWPRNVYLFLSKHSVVLVPHRSFNCSSSNANRLFSP